MDKNKRWLLFAGLFAAGILWLAIVLAEKSGCEEIIAGAEGFTAPFDTITQVAFSNQDISRKELLDNNRADVLVRILDSEDAVVGTITAKSVDLHTEGFTYADATSYEGTGALLVPGGQYRLEVEAACAGQTYRDGILVSLIRDRVSFLWFMPFFLPILAGLMLLMIFGDRIRFTFLGLIPLLAVFIFTMPLLFGLDPLERQAFGSVYAAASRLIGLEGQDPVTAYQSGFKNLDYLTYSVPLFRFWTNAGFGNGFGGESLALSGGGRTSLLQLPALLGITAARKLRLSYQLTALTGWLMQASASLVIAALALLVLEGEKSLQAFYMLAASLPSFLIGSMSFGGYGLFVSLCLLHGALCVRLKNRFSSGGTLAMFLAAAFLMLIRTEAIVLGFLVLAAAKGHYGTRAMRALSWGAWTGMTVLAAGLGLHRMGGAAVLCRDFFSSADRLFSELVGWRGYHHEHEAVAGAILLFLMLGICWRRMERGVNRGLLFSLLALLGFCIYPLMVSGGGAAFGQSFLPLVITGGVLCHLLGEGEEKPVSMAWIGTGMAAGTYIGLSHLLHL